MCRRRSALLLLAGLVLPLGSPEAFADKIKNPTAVFAGLDKITGRITSFEVAIDETVQFGTLQLTPRICYTRPPTEAPNTTAFIEVEEPTETKRTRRVFGGWVFAASPGLHAIEHPVYDLWLTGCKGGVQSVAEETPPVSPRAPAARDGRQDRPRQPVQQPARQPGPPATQQQPQTRQTPAAPAPAPQPQRVDPPFQPAVPRDGAPRPPGTVPGELRPTR
jgi:hypothetical protein